MIPKAKPIRSQKIRDAARGEHCTMNGPTCRYDRETTVFCHLNESFAGKGMGIKAHDIAGFFGCSECHSAYDLGQLGDKYFYLLRAVTRTLTRLYEMGLLEVKGAEKL